jgi:hypothetical protein
LALVGFPWLFAGAGLGFPWLSAAPDLGSCWLFAPTTLAFLGFCGVAAEPVAFGDPAAAKVSKK